MKALDHHSFHNKGSRIKNIPWIRLNRYYLCQLGYGANQKFKQQLQVKQVI